VGGRADAVGRRLGGGLRQATVVFARLALGIGFLSAVADRFGLWGPPGATNVAWGSFAHFLAYMGRIAPFLPAAWLHAAGWIVTALEVLLGGALIAGVRVRLTAGIAGCLLLVFAIGMTTGTGLKTALDASVFTAAAAAFLLATQAGTA